MKTVITVAALLAATLQAQAISRYNSESLTCRQAQSIVASEGAAILRFRSARNPSLTLYDRYVAHSGLCTLDEYAEAAWVPTADAHACPLYTCERRQKLFWDD